MGSTFEILVEDFWPCCVIMTAWVTYVYTYIYTHIHKHKGRENVTLPTYIHTYTDLQALYEDIFLK